LLLKPFLALVPATTEHARTYFSLVIETDWPTTMANPIPVYKAIAVAKRAPPNLAAVRVDSLSPLAIRGADRKAYNWAFALVFRC
jgi:hypothetical protein